MWALAQLGTMHFPYGINGLSKVEVIWGYSDTTTFSKIKLETLVLKYLVEFWLWLRYGSEI